MAQARVTSALSGDYESIQSRRKHPLWRRSTRPLKSISEEHSDKNGITPKNIFLRTRESKRNFYEFGMIANLFEKIK